MQLSASGIADSCLERCSFDDLDDFHYLCRNQSRGLEEGMNIGRAEREKHKAIEVVRFLKSSGSSVELITGATGLSREEIEGL